MRWLSDRADLLSGFRSVAICVITASHFASLGLSFLSEKEG